MIIDLEKHVRDRQKQLELPELPDDVLQEYMNHFSNTLQKYGFDSENRRFNESLKRYFSLFYAGNGKYRKPSKGLLLMGTSGTGKTFALQLLSGIFEISFVTAAELARIFSIDGDGGFWTYIEQYRKNALIIDDVGAERETKHYGNAGVIGEYMTTRYENWKYDNQYTFISTNLREKDFIARYGQRLWSRLNEMCFIIAVTGRDRRLEK